MDSKILPVVALEDTIFPFETYDCVARKPYVNLAFDVAIAQYQGRVLVLKANSAQAVQEEPTMSKCCLTGKI